MGGAVGAALSVGTAPVQPVHPIGIATATLPAMAVPKQKQSHARTTQRRAQHKIEAPTYNACPHCHSPRLPHRVCPVCGNYKGREVIVPDRDEPIA
jgi:large subunit ribosomal protein L32